MIKVSVMYPFAPATRFDHAYYCNKHMPLVKSRMGESCRYYTVDQGLTGGSPDAPPTYIGMSHIFCDSVEAFQNSFGRHADEIMKDIPNFTGIAPVIQFSEVLVERG
ncbi:MAG: EthD family reductase [Rhodanobacteraceae bacterium]|nr:MAG: EthD family reductase [Rhodanobacteraceae bacterium]